MGYGFVERNNFSCAVTDAFSQQNIGATAAKLGEPLEDWDHLDILHRLELLPFVPAGKLDAYRAKLGIPELHQEIISDALRYGLTATPAPMPVVFHVNDGAAEGVTVTSDLGTIYVTVTRKGYDTPNG